MLKKLIKFTDYNGNVREEEYYFNLNRAELTEMAASVNGGFDQLLKRIISEKDTTKLMNIFKDIILKSYGEKSFDGRTFDKEDEDGKPLYRKFYRTEAYSELLMELLSSSEKAANFVNAIIPNTEEFSNVISMEAAK